MLEVLTIGVNHSKKFVNIVNIFKPIYIKCKPTNKSSLTSLTHIRSILEDYFIILAYYINPWYYIVNKKTRGGNKMNLQKIAQQIKENEIEYIGVRTLSDDEQYEIGDYCRDSYEWDGENDCSTYDLDGEEGESADGTCATHVETDYAYEIEEIKEALEVAIASNKGYAGAKRAVIAGRTTSTDGVFDEGEIRLVDAYVVAYV